MADNSGYCTRIIYIRLNKIFFKSPDRLFGRNDITSEEDIFGRNQDIKSLWLLTKFGATVLW